jgi:hypothetical protein
MVPKFLFCRLIRLSSFRGKEFGPNRLDKPSKLFSAHLPQFRLESISNLLSMIWDLLDLEDRCDDSGPEAFHEKVS